MLRGPKEIPVHDNNSQKVYPQPAEEASAASRNKESMENLVSKIFANVSSLKAAYVQLQEAHTPYNPDKIQAADKLVIEQLLRLSELKHAYRDHKPKLAASSPHDSRLLAEIQEQQNLLKTYEVMVKKFRSQIQNRDTEILQLQQQIQESQQRKIKLEKKLKQRGLVSREELGDSSESYFSIELTPTLFASVAETAHKAIHDFSKPLINMMKSSGWDLDAAAKAIEPSAVYARRVHKKFAFEAHVGRRMFAGFHEDSFCVNMSGLDVANEGFFHQFLSIRSMDPMDVLSQSPDSIFGRFCREKYLTVIHSKMESSFFGNADQRSFVSSGGHPRTPFYQAFVKMAKSVWLLHRLAFSFDLNARVFQVANGTEYSEVYMESVVKDIAVLGDGERRPVVEVMVIPGFVVGGSVIRSQVYLSDAKYAE